MTESEIILDLESRWVSRQELCRALGVSDRAMRSYIEDLNQRLSQYGKCIVSTSSRNGYHIPNPFSEDDLRVVAHAVEELKSRAISVFERRKVLEDFLRSATTAKEEQKEVQLSLF